MPKEFHLSKPKFTLTEFGIQLTVSQNLEHKPQITLMLLLGLGVDQDIVNEDHDELILIDLCTCSDLTKKSYNFIILYTTTENNLYIFGLIKFLASLPMNK